MDRIAQRLGRDGVLERVSERRRWRTVWAWEPVSSFAAWPAARLERLARRRGQLQLPDGLLAGLVAALDLTSVVVADGDRGTLACLARWVEALPPPAAHLVAQVRLAAGSVVLTGRP